MNSIKHKNTNMRQPRQRRFYRSEMCDDPKLFETTYWNCSDGEKYIRSVEGKGIIANRNWIAKIFKLSRNAHSSAPQYAYSDQELRHELGDWYDHAEVYECPGGWVIFLSPYGHYYGSHHSNDAVPNGWTRTRPIYNMEASTIYKFIPGRGANARMERLGAVAPAIQRQFRKARYDPKYKMCRAVLYRNLEECGALTNGEADNVWQECGIIN